MEYAMTIVPFRSHSKKHPWHRCRATTLRGAKCQATRHLKSSMLLDDLLQVAEVHRGPQGAVDYCVVADWDSLYASWRNKVL